ncbi:uncharacterized protein DUF5132 [Humitalea rosea]|uniref:Uncharacterized protein DUF5132 n=1 Tax=Humitalea rosea TaxID=990373 RepID=A0A2W7IIX9_9PROT|nr:DUF5132 domain-containing protein [Humitalea rosea]PZW46835.1 uncharacterized protein DUF5132 [Humitalea rosea]
MVPVLLFGAGIAVGLGVAALAPGLMPQIARAARPTAKEALKTALIGYSQLRIAAAEAAEAASDLVAEVEHDLATAPPPDAAPAGAESAPEPAAAAAAAAAARAVAAARGRSDG